MNAKQKLDAMLNVVLTEYEKAHHDKAEKEYVHDVDASFQIDLQEVYAKEDYKCQNMLDFNIRVWKGSISYEEILKSTYMTEGFIETYNPDSLHTKEYATWTIGKYPDSQYVFDNWNKVRTCGF